MRGLNETDSQEKLNKMFTYFQVRRNFLLPANYLSVITASVALSQNFVTTDSCPCLNLIDIYM